MENSSKSPLIKVAICFFLSGMAALLYQTAWMRQLSVVFGTSELAVATVLTAYMSGLALGAALAGKFINKIRRPLLVYGVLEGGIAITAILVPYLLFLGGQAAVFFLGGQPSPPDASGFGQLLFYFLTTLVILVIPTALMGATLPLLSKYVVKKNEQVGSRIGALYAINTFGAVAGTLFAAFVLLPHISLMSTIFIGAAMNLIVLLVVMQIVKDFEPKKVNDTHQSESKHITSTLRSENIWILPVMTASGVATFVYEVLWTRLISHILGGSVPAFAVMLASFLIGIAAGSAVAIKFAKTQEVAKKAFVISQIGIASLSVFIYFMVDISLPESGGLFANSLLAFSLILPSTLFIGATFPLAVRIFSKNELDAPSASARVYSWNTIGAIFGATFAGYFLIPTIKYSGAVQFAVSLNLVLACIVAFFTFQNQKLYFKFTPFLLLILVVVFYKPGSPDNVISFSPLPNFTSKQEIIYYDVGRSSTVLALEDKNDERFIYIRNNGLPESSIRKKGVPLINSNAVLLSNLPVIARPNAKEMLIVGFGGGVVAENIPPSIESVEILELEHKVIEANKSISSIRANDPFEDSRVKIIYNDARSALQLTDKKYDIIVSQPSHPWTAGASHLYTQEYMQLVEDHLGSDGVFLQWMNYSFTDEFLLRSLASSLAHTFDYVRVYQFAQGPLFFLASNSQLEVEKNILRNHGRPLSEFPDYYQSIGLGTVEAVLAGLVMEDAQVRDFSKLGKVITDDFNIFGTRSALSIDNKQVLTNSRVGEIVLEYSPVYSIDSWIYKDFSGQINFPHLVNRVATINGSIHSNELVKILKLFAPIDFESIRAKSLFFNNQSNEARNQLLTVLESEPNNEQFKYNLVNSYLQGSNTLENLSLIHI